MSADRREFAVVDTVHGTLALASDRVRAIHDARAWFGGASPRPFVLPNVPVPALSFSAEAAAGRIVVVAARGKEFPVTVRAVLGIVDVAPEEVLLLPPLVVHALPFLCALVTPPAARPVFVVDPDALFGELS